MLFMNKIKKFDELSESGQYQSNKIVEYIEQNKSNKSSYEMYKELRDIGYNESDLEEYFHDNY